MATRQKKGLIGGESTWMKEMLSSSNFSFLLRGLLPQLTGSEQDAEWLGHPCSKVGLPGCAH